MKQIRNSAIWGAAWRTGLLGSLLAAGIIAMGGCGGAATKKQNQQFFTSGNQDADQRAAQRMAEAEQLSGSGEGSGETGRQKVVPVQSGQPVNATGGTNTNTMVKVEGKTSLYQRLGGEVGISNIVADYTPRVLNDPRVNWTRQGVTRGGFSFHRGQSETWNATPQNVAVLKKHMVEFIALATGGPSHYEGRDLVSVHKNLHISNAEFDAAMGDLKATLDRLQIPNQEQKELLAVFESTRTEIATER